MSEFRAEVPALSAADAFRFVQEHAGASMWRDAADDYVVAELLSLGKRGATIADEATLGLTSGVGEVPGGVPPRDSDRDLGGRWVRLGGA